MKRSYCAAPEVNSGIGWILRRVPGSHELPSPVDPARAGAYSRTRPTLYKEVLMSWSLAGSYFETCSCDVVCPCTASLSLGATRDRCKVVLVFNVKQGEV